MSASHPLELRHMIAFRSDIQESERGMGVDGNRREEGRWVVEGTCHINTHLPCLPQHRIERGMGKLHPS